MAEYVDDFLMELTKGDAPNFDGNAVVRLMVERYQTAMSTRNWPAVTALGPPVDGAGRAAQNAPGVPERLAVLSLSATRKTKT